MKFLNLLFTTDTKQLDDASRKLDEVTKKSADAATNTEKLNASFKSGSGTGAISTALEKVTTRFNELAELANINTSALSGVTEAATSAGATLATLAASTAAAAGTAGGGGFLLFKGTIASLNTQLDGLRDRLAGVKQKQDALTESYKAARAAFTAETGRTRAAPNSPEAAMFAQMRRERDEAWVKDAKPLKREMAQKSLELEGLQVTARLLPAVATGVGAVATAAAAASAAINLIAFSARDAADAAAEMADKFGVGTLQLAAIDLAARENAGSAEGLQRIYDKLSKSLNKLDEDSEKTRYAFESLGITQSDLAGLSESEIAGLIVKNFELLGRSSKATAAAIQLLGPSFREQIPAIKATADGLSSYVERVARFGADASPALVKAGAEQEEALSNLGLAWKGLTNEIAESAGTALKTAAEFFANLLNGIRTVLAEIRGAREQAAAVESIPQAERNALLKRARDEVYNGSNPNANEGDVRRRFNELIKERIEAVRNEDRETARFASQAQQYAAAIVKAKSDAAKAPQKTGGAEKEDPFLKAQQDLKRQLDVNKQATVEQKTLFEVEQGKYRDFSATQKDILLTIARQVDERNKLGVLAERQLKLTEDYEQAEARANEQLKQRVEYEKQLTEEAARRLRLAGEDVLKAEKVRRDETGMSATDRGANAQIRGVQRDAAEAIRQLTPYMVDYEERVKQIRAAEAEATAAIREASRQRVEYNKDWTNGAKNALSDYLDKVNDVAGATEAALSKAFQGAEDALVDFVINGKASFSDLARSIIADLFRIWIRKQMVGIFGAVGDLFGAVKGGGAVIDAGVTAMTGFAAGGGNIPAGSTTIVGEYGPEVLKMGNQAGYVTPNWMLKGGQGVNVGNINITVNGGSTNGETGQVVSAAVIEAMKKIADGRISNAKLPGGLLRT